MEAKYTFKDWKCLVRQRQMKIDEAGTKIKINRNLFIVSLLIVL